MIHPMAEDSNCGAFVVKPGVDQQQPVRQIECGKWSVGFWSCCDHCIPNCMMAWCCPCVSLSQIYARMGLMTYSAALVRFFALALSVILIRYVPFVSRRRLTSSTKTLSGNAWLLFIVVQQITFIYAIVFARRRIRQRFKIPGDICEDVCLSYCCSYCAIAQMATHVKSYKPSSCNFSGPDVLPAYEQWTEHC
ncbi:hypothetical protein Poli38472_009569 [Pythium oligandrum]|uniref:PLAC8 family protein n=1 Tax=Pythium oligandrum TaxID=41045 RepID=A0A8K1CER2_PYTOL|nr:hypothetical protein Poli38472_009569 [Pythium oligandrum]|eukprot:TMW62076.1 hypothetical protein Poli38472_009569 [Pythium oligandrum]